MNASAYDYLRSRGLTEAQLHQVSRIGNPGSVEANRLLRTFGASNYTVRAASTYQRYDVSPRGLAHIKRSAAKNILDPLYPNQHRELARYQQPSEGDGIVWELDAKGKPINPFWYHGLTS